MEDIRLTPDELDDAMHNPPTTIYNEFLTLEQEARHIADTATNKAIKKIVEDIERHLAPEDGWFIVGKPYLKALLSLVVSPSLEANK